MENKRENVNASMPLGPFQQGLQAGWQYPYSQARGDLNSRPGFFLPLPIVISLQEQDLIWTVCP